MKIIISFQKKLYKVNWFEKLYIKAIKLWTKSKYFHTEIIFSNKRISAYTNTGVNVYYFENNFDFKHFDYYEINVLEPTSYQEMLIWNYINEQIETGYDWNGIFFSQIFRLGINNPNKWFCSEIVVKILQLFLFEPVLDCLPNKVSPAKLYKLIKDKSIKIEPEE